MKNLKLSTEISASLELQSDGEQLLFSAIDIERNRLFFASSSNFIYSTQFPSHQNAKAQSGIVLSAEVQPLDLEVDDIITSFDYLLEKESLIIGTSSGLLLLYMVDSNATEVVGRVDGGVKCISPSPDGDLLAVTTGLGQLLVMTHDWDVLYETAFEDQPEDIDVNELSNSPSFTRGNLVSWRGDGRYFATLSNLQNLRKIKVWERDSGSLHSSSDPKPFSADTLEWMPSGAKIATVYDRRNENICPSIAFFERNGLERSSFSINEPSDAVVEALKWNCSSDLLCVLVRCEKYYSLKVWSFSNNHWYLKQEIRYSRQERLQLMWDPTKPLQLICWTSTGQISVYNFIWLTAVMDNSVALVIDDSNILVTPLFLSLIPPPMFSFKLKFPSAVREMAFYSSNSKILLAAYLSDESFCVVELPALSFWEDLEGKEFAIEASVCETALGSLLHLEWIDSHILLGVSHFGFNHERRLSETASETKHLGYHLMEIGAFCSENHVPDTVTCSSWNVKVSNQIFLEKLVISIAPNIAKNGSAFVQLNGGHIFEYVSQASTQSASSPYFEEYNAVILSSSCPWMTVANVTTGAQLRPLLFGLNEHGVLHVDGAILCNNCSSFSIYSNSSDQIVTHLILTTKQDLLYVVDIVDVLDGNALVKYDNFLHIARKKREEECRNFINLWERGAKIIGVLHGDEAAVILQTIRGNLECICPRKLVLTSITNALVQKRFKDALLMVRRHRIDFNIVVDYCGWQAFLPFASDFVRQVNNLSYITEFVCAIKDESTTLKLYKNYISLPSSDVKDIQTGFLGVFNSKSKVSGVLLAIRRALEEQVPESPARELCILTTLARSDPPSLEEALARIKVTREMELSGSNDQRRTSYPSAEEALKHLLWLSDADAVFEAALGLYDLNLAAIVALNAQRDPKEFLPFLQELECMPTLLMQYRIDIRLRRYEKALKHIVSAGETFHSDCMALLKDQPQLFPLGLQLFTDPSKRNQVYEAWGDHLVNEKCFEEAAMTFLCCFSLEKALKAYRDCGHWSGVLTVAGLLKFEKEEVLKLAHELCEELQALGKPVEAAKIALEYCGDVNSAISLLISAREWEEALRIAFMHRNDDLITEVKNASAECAFILVNEYEEGLEKTGKYLTRFLAVRQRRLLLAAKLRSEEHSVNDIDDDTISEASSNFSGMSAYTTGTRRSSAGSVTSGTSSRARENRRKKNQGKIRAGSPGEELALVDHLRGMAITSGARRELKSLLSTLLMLGMEETARKLQHIGETFQLSNVAAVKLAEDATSTDVVDDQTYALDRYLKKVKSEVCDSEAFSWRSKILILP
ncbi:elongator complex protein 1 isoform X1 [Spinacia oleracea]|uniref:Elongator complex protein 1 n=2 Tax=Spinacia oleracea TaxID=3562 RepID=A0A9R0K7L6_SPIOL|nr:elongator complex protein 1 isoform X1 [Spinacia oleracea]XP_021861506.2 elongator complex protein 1 isoform X1 [Spinacia oleracea]